VKKNRIQFFATRTGIILTGVFIGAFAALLPAWGNPANMGICVACFLRDITGALKLHTTATVQYLRPEIPGFVLGSLVAALVFGEFRARGGAGTVVRFVLGFFAMTGALAFLGCPWRAMLRFAGGDLNGLIGLIGLALGIAVGVFFLKRGYSLGRSREMSPAAGLVMPIVMAALLVFLFAKSSLVAFSEKGPGSLHAPALVSLAVALVIGFLAQRTRFCTMGAIRDLILVRDTHLASGAGALVVSAFAVNLILGRFHPGFAAQPVSHSSHLWNLLGMFLSGLAFSLAGGCPGRQLFLSGEGDGDATVFVFGMIAGAAFSHNFGLAGKPDAMTDGKLVVGGLGTPGMIAVIVGIAVCLVIGFAMREKSAGSRAATGSGTASGVAAVSASKGGK